MVLPVQRDLNPCRAAAHHNRPAGRLHSFFSSFLHSRVRLTFPRCPAIIACGFGPFGQERRNCNGTQKRHFDAHERAALPLRDRNHGQERLSLCGFSQGRRSEVLAAAASWPHQLRGQSLFLLLQLCRQPLFHRPGAAGEGKAPAPGGAQEPGLGRRSGEGGLRQDL